MTYPNFQNKVALITGASSGIGRATAIAFARADAKIVVVSRRPAENEETLRLISQAGSSGHFVQTDVSSARDVEAMVAETVQQFGRLDFAFNNAGIVESQKPFLEQPEETFDRVMDVTVKGVWLCMKAQIRQMLQTGGGAIVNMSSIAGVVGGPGVPIYTASKHAVLGLTRATAIEFAKAGIRINAVCPGSIETEMLAGYFKESEDTKKHMMASHPIGRLGKAEEVASAVLWLCSEGAGFVVGHPLLVDGGYTAQ